MVKKTFFFDIWLMQKIVKYFLSFHIVRGVVRKRKRQRRGGKGLCETVRLVGLQSWN